MPAFYGLHSAMFYCLSMHLRTLLALAIPRTKAGGSVRFKFAPRIANHFVGTRTESFESSRLLRRGSKPAKWIRFLL
jgi:hypothetical protein